MVDYITGQLIPDHDDEQIRQSIERLLIEEKGYDQCDVEVDVPFELKVDDQTESGRAELLVRVERPPGHDGQKFSGIVVTRERESLAATRLASCPPAILTVVTNGEEAEILDTRTGKVIDQGLDAIPTKGEARKMALNYEYTGISDKQRLKESRIYLCFSDFQCPEECEI